MNYLKYLYYCAMTDAECKKYKYTKALVKKQMIAMDLVVPNPLTIEPVPHPQLQSHIQTCIANFIKYATTEMARDKDLTIALGDSILAQAKEEASDAIKPLLNFACGGFRARDMLKTFQALLPVFKQYNFIPRRIVVGTPDGNGLLQHYEINSVKNECLNLLNAIRAEFPALTTRIIVYGLPATISDYAQVHFVNYDLNLYQWVLNDLNAVMLPLIKMFVESDHFIMKADWSCDGVHLSPKGRYILGCLIQTAKKQNYPANKLINCY